MIQKCINFSDSGNTTLKMKDLTNISESAYQIVFIATCIQLTKTTYLLYLFYLKSFMNFSTVREIQCLLTAVSKL